MSMSTNVNIFTSFNRANNFRLSNDIEDLAQECNAYMKIKFFMAKRIIQLENTVEQLKLELTRQVNNNANMMDWFSSINSTLEEMKFYSKINANASKENTIEEIKIEEIKQKKEENKEINLSGNFIESLIIVDHEENNNEDISKQNIITSPEFDHIDIETIENFNISNKNNPEIKKLEIIINEITKQNIDLTKQNLKMKNEILNKNLTLNKLQTEKLTLVNELNEILNSLSRVDMKSLNKYYLENVKLDQINIPSSLGIKYNILSAYTQIGIMLKDKTSTIKTNRKQLEEQEIDGENILNINTYRSIVKSHEEEFERLINNNLKRTKILFESDSD